MRQAALTGGAQFVSTDLEVPDLRFSSYTVKMPGGLPARCNLGDRTPGVPPHRRRESASPVGFASVRRLRRRAHFGFLSRFSPRRRAEHSEPPCPGACEPGTRSEMIVESLRRSRTRGRFRFLAI